MRQSLELALLPSTNQQTLEGPIISVKLQIQWKNTTSTKRFMKWHHIFLHPLNSTLNFSNGLGKLESVNLCSWSYDFAHEVIYSFMPKPQ